MKPLFAPTLAAALILTLPSASFAQAKRKAEAASKAASKEPAAKPEAASAPAAVRIAAAKSQPMNARVDVVDTSAKSFTMKRRDGVEIKHVLTDTTEIKNGDAAAKLEDISIGDWVSGLRTKTGENQYEVLKITRFGPRTARAKVPAQTFEGVPVQPEPLDSVRAAKKP